MFLSHCLPVLADKEYSASASSVNGMLSLVKEVPSPRVKDIQISHSPVFNVRSHEIGISATKTFSPGLISTSLAEVACFSHSTILYFSGTIRVTFPFPLVLFTKNLSLVRSETGDRPGFTIFTVTRIAEGGGEAEAPNGLSPSYVPSCHAASKTIANQATRARAMRAMRAQRFGVDHERRACSMRPASPHDGSMGVSCGCS